MWGVCATVCPWLGGGGPLQVRALIVERDHDYRRKLVELKAGHDEALEWWTGPVAGAHVLSNLMFREPVRSSAESLPTAASARTPPLPCPARPSRGQPGCLPPTPSSLTAAFHPRTALELGCLHVCLDCNALPWCTRQHVTSLVLLSGEALAERKLEVRLVALRPLLSFPRPHRCLR